MSQKPTQSSMLSPISLDEFVEYGKNFNVIPLAKELVADAETPLTLYSKLANNRPGTFLLESAEHGGIFSRYSFIGINSYSTIYERNGKLAWLGKVPVGVNHELDFLPGIENISAHLRSPKLPDAPPLTGGLVGYLGYDIVRHLEKIPELAKDALGLSQGVMFIVSDLAVYDHLKGSVILISNAINWDGKESGIENAYQDASSRLANSLQLLNQPSFLQPVNWNTNLQPVFERLTSKEEFKNEVNILKEEIASGEAFQIVLSQRFEMNTNADPFDIYRSLRRTNPSPYMFYLQIPETPGVAKAFAIVGSSPESIIKVTGQDAVIHPIAGTRPRSDNPEIDNNLANELLADPKERAEHLMLVDLGRNDLNRVSQSGSVKVVEFMKIERYSHVMHIVSTIVSKLKDSANAFSALLAVFPAGTLSGAPKVRAMEIIEANEKYRRGIYGGAIGYIDFHGNLDACIAIRTALIIDNKVIIQAGAGIVADSDPESEDQETLNKAAAVMRAITQAESFMK